MKKKGSTKKRMQPTATRKLHEPVRKRTPATPISRAPEADKLAERIEAHRRRLETIQKAYCESTAETFNEPEPIAKRKVALRRNMVQLGKALGEWHCTALDLLAEGQQAALLWRERRERIGVSMGVSIFTTISAKRNT